MPEDHKVSAAEDKLELAGYRISERIEDRFWKSVSLKTGVFVAGLTLFGFVPFPIFFQWVSDKVTNNISAKVDRDTERLRDRVNSDLAEIPIQKASLEKGLKEARSDLDSLREQITNMQNVSSSYESDSRKLQVLQTGYESLQTRVEKLGRGVDSATSIAENSRLSTVSLGLAISSFNLGEPAIFSAPHIFGPSFIGTISGANFGKDVGRVYVRVSVLPDVRSILASTTLPVGNNKEIELDREAIAGWGENEIKITYRLR